MMSLEDVPILPEDIPKFNETLSREPNKELYKLIKNLNTYENAVINFGKKYGNESESFRLESGRRARQIFRYGVTIANKIDEFIRSGRLEEAQRVWFEKTCESIRELSTLEGVGPIRAAELVEAGVDSVDDLYCHTEKLTRQQLIGLEHHHDLQLKIPQKEIMDIGEMIKNAILLFDGSYEVTLCGELRRGRMKCSQIECLVKANQPNEATEDAVKEIVARLTNRALVLDTISIGPTKFMGVCRISENHPVRRLSLRLASSLNFPFLLLYHTGPPSFLKKMVKRARERGWALNEHSLHRLNPNGGIGEPKLVTSEEEIFDILELPFVPPEQRNLFKEPKKTLI